MSIAQCPLLSVALSFESSRWPPFSLSSRLVVPASIEAVVGILSETISLTIKPWLTLSSLYLRGFPKVVISSNLLTVLIMKSSKTSSSSSRLPAPRNTDSYTSIPIRNLDIKAAPGSIITQFSAPMLTYWAKSINSTNPRSTNKMLRSVLNLHI